jgi:hypothetical protein
MLQQLLNNPVSFDVFKEKLGPMMGFYERSVASVEIVRHKLIHKVDFIIPPYFEKLEKKKKNMFNENVDRSSLRSKITFMLTESIGIIG